MTTTKLNLPRYIQLVENDKENIIITVIAIVATSNNK